eukprot:jgi/Botrbrau1/23638/Bobra.55_2s0025.1
MYTGISPQLGVKVSTSSSLSWAPYRAQRPCCSQMSPKKKTVGNAAQKKRRVDAPDSSARSPTLVTKDYEVTSSFKLPGLTCIDYRFYVPLDYSGKEEGIISIFAREVFSTSKSNSLLPYLLFFQGGPGCEAPRPASIDSAGWLRTATNYFRVLLLDQRGTGLSTPITTASLARIGNAEQQVRYISFFRADSIVLDAENIRCQLAHKITATNAAGKWSILGQSFGGFCAFTYLSLAPHGLVEVLVTGGIPPDISLACSASEIYPRLLERVRTQNIKFYERYPQDIERVRNVVLRILEEPLQFVPLPSGGKLTVRALQQLGLAGLGSGGGFDRLHYLFERAFDGPDLSLTFLKDFEAWVNWEIHPLYALLQEAIYCQGASSNWAAHKALQADLAKRRDFDAVFTASNGGAVLFLGEMVFPWMYEGDFAELTPFAETAELLAAKTDWEPLYDLDVLATNTVPIASATYYEDMFVDFDMAQRTAGRVKTLRQWITNEYMHSGVRDDGNKIFDTLLGFVRGTNLLK